MIAEWMERFVEFATTWLWLLLLANWRALPILVLVAVSQRHIATCRFFSRRWDKSRTYA